MGGNAAEAHPVGFRWAMEAKIHSSAKLVRSIPFTRTASVADFYTIRSGTDITFLSGVLLYLMTNENTTANTRSLYQRQPDRAWGLPLRIGLFSGYDAEKAQVRQNQLELSWTGAALREARHRPTDTAALMEPAEEHVSRAIRRTLLRTSCGTPRLT